MTTPNPPVETAVELMRHALDAYGKPHPATPAETERLQRIAGEQRDIIKSLAPQEIGAVAIMEASIAAGAIIQLAYGLDMDPHQVLDEIISQALDQVR